MPAPEQVDVIKGDAEAERPPASWLPRLRRDWGAMLGVLAVAGLMGAAVFAPLLANGRPLLIHDASGFSSPALRFVFSPDSPERMIEKLFNFAMLLIPAAAIIWVSMARLGTRRRALAIAIAAAVISVPFLSMGLAIQKTNWREAAVKIRADGGSVVFAPIPYGPFENVSSPYEKPSAKHWIGTDNIGRDIMSRMIYGARISLAVGILATMLSLCMGTLVGLASGYLGGVFDMAVMRVVEIVICFPSFLLLLIIMALLMDAKFEQSALVVIPVIGLLGWTGLCRIVRGEVLKQRALPYVQGCEAMGVKGWRILIIHILPNVSAPIFVVAVFEVAANVLAESGLSFLGFGVQPPTASWGELLRQALADPLGYWNLTLWPGLLIFITVSSFNLVGEGLRKALDPKSQT